MFIANILNWSSKKGRKQIWVQQEQTMDEKKEEGRKDEPENNKEKI